MQVSAITKAIEYVTAEYHKAWKKSERDQQRAVREHAERFKRLRSREVSVKDAVLDVLPTAIRETSGDGRYVFPQRNLFYTVRAAIQSITSKELTQTNFRQIIDQYEHEHGLIEMMYRDPRGFLIEPHTGNKIPLGTREVDDYAFPPLLFDKLAFFEKKGFVPLFESVGLAEKYDMSIVCAEGYASRAAKALLSEAERGHGMTVLCFHDADPAGYNIARKLRKKTITFARDIHVIDIGLHIGEALEFGLQPETFIRQKALPQGLELTDLERKHFEGVRDGFTSKGNPRWKCQRIELNDFARTPERFIAWIESKLADHGLAKKLVPNDADILSQAQDDRDKILRDSIRQQILSTIGVEGMVARLAGQFQDKIDLADIPGAVAKWAESLPAERWADHVRGEVQVRQSNLDTDIRGAVHAALRDIEIT